MTTEYLKPDDVQADPKRTFMYWVAERERIRHSKMFGVQRPWSSDPVFQTTYFCNVNRENDKVTRWIRQAYYDYRTHYPIVPNMIMARMVNKPKSLDNIHLHWPWSTFNPHLFRKIMSQPGAWGSAYIVSTNGRKAPKHEYIGALLERAWGAWSGPGGATLPGTLSAAHRAIQGLDGMGSFMAAQVVADIKNTEGSVLEKAPDWWTFAAHGPGSLRGLSWFWGKQITPASFTEALESARIAVTVIDPVLLSNVCNQDLQNCFCEFDKYMRVSTGTGRSKRKYNG